MEQAFKILPQEPSEEMVSNLARDIVFWMDTWSGSLKTPRNLFFNLKNCGYKEEDIPQWLKDEPEMKQLDSVPSKATRAVIIYKAMYHAFNADKRLESGVVVNSGALQLAIDSLNRGTPSQKEIAAELLKTAKIAQG